MLWWKGTVEKAEKEKAKDKEKIKQQEKVTAFHRWKEDCVCGNKPYAAKGLQLCPNCGNILKSTCCKAKCRDEEGKNAVMIEPIFDRGTSDSMTK